jgi:RNA polymerase sigma-70 factor, ECF subfamily
MGNERSLCEAGLMEDRLLVFRCRGGSRPALRRIYEKYRDYLLILAIALCYDVNMAEDAVQDAFVGFAGKLDRFTLTGSLKAYLATCVANRVRDLMRNRRGKTVSLDEVCEVVSTSDGPAERILLNEELRQLSSALATLPYEQREVIALRFHSRMRFADIAKSLSIPVNTAKGRFRYGIDKLRSILNSEVKK